MTALVMMQQALRLGRSQWLEHDALQRLQAQKLRRLVRHAYDTVPFHRRRFDAAGIDPGDICTPADLQYLPVTTRADLQACDAADLTSSTFAGAALVAEHTSGSTGRPFSMHFDRRFVAVRNALFLRALGVAGYRPGQPLMLVTGPRSKPPRRWLNWHYVSIELSPEELLAQYARIRPRVLYGCVTPLRQLAGALAGSMLPRPAAVVTTAESLDPPTRALLESAYGAPVFDVYGLTEMGLVGFECHRHDGYHLSEETTVTELLTAPGENTGRLVMTNLELYAMPLIRYETGDIAVADSGEPCACGRASSRLARVEGRLVDSVRTAEGATISPYRVTLALEHIAGIERYQVVQEGIDDFTVRVQGSNAIRGDAVGDALRAVVGAAARVHLETCDSLDPPPGTKFRVVASRLGAAGAP